MKSKSVTKRCMKPLMIIFIILSFSGCKLILLPMDGGSITSTSGLHNCSSMSCEFEADNGFSEIFTATPDDGYEFTGWEGWGPCKDSGVVCVVDIGPLNDDLITLGLNVTLKANFKLSPESNFLGEIALLTPATVTADGISLNMLSEQESSFSYTLPAECDSWVNKSVSRMLSDSKQSNKIAIQTVISCNNHLFENKNYQLIVRENLPIGYRQSSINFTPAITSDSQEGLLTVTKSQQWTESQLQRFFSDYVEDGIAGELSIPFPLESLVIKVIEELAEDAWSELMNPQIDYPVITDSITYISTDPSGNKSDLLSGLVAYPDTNANGDFLAKDKIILLHHATGTTPSNQEADDAWFLIASVIAAKGYVVVAPDNYGRGSSKAFEETYLQAQFTAANAIDMLIAVQARDNYQQVMPVVSTPLKLSIIGYSQGGHSAVSTMIQLLLGHQDRFDVTEVYAGAGPYSLYDSFKGALESITGGCSNQAYCEDVDSDVSLPYLVDRIGPANLSYRDIGLSTTDLIIDGNINPVFSSGFLANESQYDALKTFLQIDSFSNVSNIDTLNSDVKLVLFHSEADRLVPVQNSYDFYDAISPYVSADLNTDICNSNDMLQIASLVDKAGVIHLLCGFNTIEEILSEL